MRSSRQEPDTSTVILGIDPGTIVTGYGLISNDNNDLTLVEYGTIKPVTRSPIGERLHTIYTSLQEIIVQYRPDAIAIEEPFVAKNVKSALSIGRAQAMGILAAASHQIPCYTYSPAKVKQRISDYGGSDKAQIQRMVKLLLNMTELPQPDDASDALAIALCHVFECSESALLEKERGTL